LHFKFSEQPVNTELPVLYSVTNDVRADEKQPIKNTQNVEYRTEQTMKRSM